MEPIGSVALPVPGVFDVAGLAELRRKAIMTQVELAQAAGVGVGSVAAIERGQQRPRPSTARKLAAALGVNVRTVDWPDPVKTARDGKAAGDGG